MEPASDAPIDARATEPGVRDRVPDEGESPRAPERLSMLARLAAALAHEIKNPLSTMAINLALLEEEWSRARDGGEPSARDKRFQKRVQTLQREVKRLETIVDAFLRYARGGEINRAPHDLVALVREVLDFVESEDTLAGIRHHVELPFGLPLVMLDPGAFKQALLNFLVNARQAMPIHHAAHIDPHALAAQIDPALVAQPDPDHPADLVIHTIRHADPLFTINPGGPLPFADRVECLLDLYEARLEAQAAQFLAELSMPPTIQI